MSEENKETAKRKSVILLTHIESDKKGVFGSLSRLTRIQGWEKGYHSIKANKFPFEWNGYRFEKIDWNEDVTLDTRVP